METSISQVWPQCSTSPDVTAEPASPPTVAPVARNPNRRFACSALNTSTTNDQKTEMTNRLKTDTQMKNARPIQTCCSGVALESNTMNVTRFNMKKR